LGGFSNFEIQKKLSGGTWVNATFGAGNITDGSAPGFGYVIYRTDNLVAGSTIQLRVRARYYDQQVYNEGYYWTNNATSEWTESTVLTLPSIAGNVQDQWAMRKIQPIGISSVNFNWSPGVYHQTKTINQYTYTIYFWWTLVSNIKFSNYEYQYRVAGASDWSVPPGYGPNHSYAGQTGFNVVNMMPGQSYEFRVRAIYSGITEMFNEGSYYGGTRGEGEWSDIKSFTVPAAPAFGGAPQPTALTGTVDAQLNYNPCGFDNDGCSPSYTYKLSWEPPTSGNPIYYEITSRVGNTGSYGLPGCWTPGYYWGCQTAYQTGPTVVLYQATQFRIRAVYGVCSDGCTVTGYSDYTTFVQSIAPGSFSIP
jgi:hypothetical protein